MRRLSYKQKTAISIAVAALFIAALSGALLAAGRSTHPTTARTGIAQTQATQQPITTTTVTVTSTTGPAAKATAAPRVRNHAAPDATKTTTPTPVPGSTAGPGSPPTATALPGAFPTTTPQPTSALYDDAAVVGPTSPVTIYAFSNTGPYIYITVANTGASTWPIFAPYSLGFTTRCPLGIPGRLGSDVAPGQNYTFDIQVVTPLTWTYAVHDCDFQMSNGGIPFGAVVHLHVVTTDETPIQTQPAPSCGNPSGVTWNWVNAGGGNTIACTSSGLLMQQGSSSAPQADILTVPGFDPNTNRMHVHVHFADAGSSTYAGFALETQSPDGCGGRRFLIRPDGSYRIFEYMRYVGQANCQEFLWDSGQYLASTDFDLVLGFQNGNELFYINTGMVADLGANLYGPSGITVNGSGGQVYFSNFEVDKLGAAIITYHV